MVLYDQDLIRDEVACFFWFHTGFITQESTIFEKASIDMACSDSKCKVCGCTCELIVQAPFETSLPTLLE